MSHPSTLSDYTHLSVSPQYTVRLYTPQCLIPVHSLIIHISVSHSHPSALFDYKHLSVSSSTVSHYTHLCVTQHSVSLYTSVSSSTVSHYTHLCLIPIRSLILITNRQVYATECQIRLTFGWLIGYQMFLCASGL